MTQQTPGEGQRINDRIQIPHDNTNKNLREKNLTKKLHAMIKKKQKCGKIHSLTKFKQCIFLFSNFFLFER